MALDIGAWTIGALGVAARWHSVSNHLSSPPRVRKHSKQPGAGVVLEQLLVPDIGGERIG